MLWSGQNDWTGWSRCLAANRCRSKSTMALGCRRRASGRSSAPRASCRNTPSNATLSLVETSSDEGLAAAMRSVPQPSFSICVESDSAKQYNVLPHSIVAHLRCAPCSGAACRACIEPVGTIPSPCFARRHAILHSAEQHSFSTLYIKRYRCSESRRGMSRWLLLSPRHPVPCPGVIKSDCTATTAKHNDLLARFVICHGCIVARGRRYDGRYLNPSSAVKLPGIAKCTQRIGPAKCHHAFALLVVDHHVPRASQLTGQHLVPIAAFEPTIRSAPIVPKSIYALVAQSSSIVELKSRPWMSST
jgi:hypothetical protein